MMQGRAFVLVLFSVCLILASGCRSRQAVPPPQSTPPVTVVEAEPSVPVTNNDQDFVEPAASPDVLSEDMSEANRQARERGFIRDAFFGYDASTLDTNAEAALQASASWLRSNPAYRLRVEGHCDERGTEQYNLALGERRAESAAAYLASLGVGRERLQTLSYGEERPFEEGDNEAAYAQNRRAHLVLTGKR